MFSARKTGIQNMLLHKDGIGRRPDERHLASNDNKTETRGQQATQMKKFHFIKALQNQIPCGV